MTLWMAWHVSSRTKYQQKVHYHHHRPHGPSSGVILDNPRMLRALHMCRLCRRKGASSWTSFRWVPPKEAVRQPAPISLPCLEQRAACRVWAKIETSTDKGNSKSNCPITEGRSCVHDGPDPCGVTTCYNTCSYYIQHMDSDCAQKARPYSNKIDNMEFKGDLEAGPHGIAMSAPFWEKTFWKSATCLIEDRSGAKDCKGLVGTRFTSFHS